MLDGNNFLSTWETRTNKAGQEYQALYVHIGDYEMRIFPQGAERHLILQYIENKKNSNKITINKSADNN